MVEFRGAVTWVRIVQLLSNGFGLAVIIPCTFEVSEIVRHWAAEDVSDVTIADHQVAFVHDVIGMCFHEGLAYFHATKIVFQSSVRVSLKVEYMADELIAIGLLQGKFRAVRIAGSQ